MRSRSFLTTALAVALASCAAACSSEPEPNDAPILDSVATADVVREADGSYEIPLLILFHDNDREAVTHVRYRVGTAFEGMLDIETPNPTRESAEITLVIPAAACSDKRQTIEVSVLDARGAESHPVPQIIDLE